MSPTSRLIISSLLASCCLPASALAEEAPSDIIVTGTRVTGMRAADSAAPVQVINSQDMAAVGQQDLTQVLAQTLPSLNFQAFGGDTANLTLTAALRGLSPNDTLVLVNGKRRHFTANLAVLGGSPYSGAAATDLSFIPTNSIGRIEILQDGAAAQYGSDAIAGVVNIILKSDDSGGLLTATGGQYYKGDGETVSAALNAGFALGDSGFVNVTGEYKFHDYTQRGGCDRRYSNQDCIVRTDINPIDAAGVASNPFFPRVNNILGDARYKLFNVVVNAGYDLTDSLSAYAFGSYGKRQAYAYENYRRATRISGTTSDGETVYPLLSGFNPQEHIDENDVSLTGGFKGDVSGWMWDLSLTYGRDKVALYTVASANPTVYAQQQTQNADLIGLQRDFYDGQLINSEWTVDAGVTKDFEVGMAKPLTLAVGGQWRRDTYQIKSGEFASYFGGGGQSYPGFAPTDAGTYNRTAWAGYIDLAVDPVEGLHLDLAGRYEHYSDFGNVWNGKATARYDFNPNFGIRGTVSNGFRGPTLAESYYSSVNVGPGSTFGQLPPNSTAATVLGFAPLKPEKATSFSLGFVSHPLSGLQLTLDAYQIKLKDRIVPSAAIFGSLGTDIVSQAVIDALISRGVSLDDATSYAGINIFTNGADTRTRGVEATLDYTSDFGEDAKVNWTLGVNYNQTKLLKINPLPAQVTNASYSQTNLLDPNSIDGLTTATPRVKVIANVLFTRGALSLNVRETIYGVTHQRTSYSGSGYSTADGYTELRIGATPITDVNLGYMLTPSLRFDLGANNLFDKKAPTVPNIGGRPANGSNVYDPPITFTPWGINGGYYYARATFTF